jgi:hypothetical protein
MIHLPVQGRYLNKEMLHSRFQFFCCQDNENELPSMFRQGLPQLWSLEPLTSFISYDTLINPC